MCLRDPSGSFTPLVKRHPAVDSNFFSTCSHMVVSEIESLSLSLSSAAPASVPVVAKCLEPGALSTGRHEALDGYALH